MIVTNLPTYQKKYQDLVLIDTTAYALIGTLKREDVKNKAMKELIEKAKKYNADAIINIKIDDIFAGNYVYCSVYGTSIKILED